MTRLLSANDKTFVRLQPHCSKLSMACAGPRPRNRNRARFRWRSSGPNREAPGPAPRPITVDYVNFDRRRPVYAVGARALGETGRRDLKGHNTRGRLGAPLAAGNTRRRGARHRRGVPGCGWRAVRGARRRRCRPREPRRRSLPPAAPSRMSPRGALSPRGAPSRMSPVPRPRPARRARGATRRTARAESARIPLPFPRPAPRVRIARIGKSAIRFSVRKSGQMARDPARWTNDVQGLHVGGGVGGGFRPLAAPGRGGSGAGLADGVARDR